MVYRRCVAGQFMPICGTRAEIAGKRGKSLQSVVRTQGPAMRTHKLSAIVASCLIILPAVPAGASVWSVIKNEQDPFDKAKSTFIATTGTIGDGLAIRCLEGGISLLLLSGPSNASAGEPTELKIVADDLPVREEEDAAVLAATNFSTSVQFGDKSTLQYLKGAQKISVRYSLGDAHATESFSGGRSLADVITKALKACGKEIVDPPKASTKTESVAPSKGRRQLASRARRNSLK